MDEEFLTSIEEIRELQLGGTEIQRRSIREIETGWDQPAEFTFGEWVRVLELKKAKEAEKVNEDIKESLIKEGIYRGIVISLKGEYKITVNNDGSANIKVDDDFVKLTREEFNKRMGDS